MTDLSRLKLSSKRQNALAPMYGMAAKARPTVATADSCGALIAVSNPATNTTNPIALKKVATIQTKIFIFHQYGWPARHMSLESFRQYASPCGVESQ